MEFDNFGKECCVWRIRRRRGSPTRKILYFGRWGREECGG
jgi:hypothetical protein